MPHEVIMPALGMAQDSGLIVAWHKNQGDAVSMGDTLFEVETDKATMEVEAQASGFLNRVSRQAGDDVPVGEVIAVIGDSAEAAPPEQTPKEMPKEMPENIDPAAPEMPKGAEVIMPALGMAQDSGVIVAWHKSPGDAAASSDVLFEVETDKSTVEVEAGHDGYVAALLAEPGDEVPVGDVIAVISATKPETPVQLSRQSQGPSASRSAETPAAAPAPSSEPAASPQVAKPAAMATGDRILVSPKARRLALEQGLDLKGLIEAGIPQPFHVADLEMLRSLPAKTATGPSGTQNVLARVSVTGFSDFFDRFDGQIPTPGAVWAAFAAASLRSAGSRSDIVVRLDTPLLGSSAFFVDPDLVPLSRIAPCEADAPQIVLRDLTASRITGLTLVADDAPVLTVSRDGTDYVLSLDFTEAQLAANAAIRLVEGVAARLGEPLRHLL